MARRIVINDTLYECPNCGYKWHSSNELDFDELERVPCCPECRELIEDGDD